MLSEAVREVIARDLVRIEASARWDAFFADPWSRVQFELLAEEALDERGQGKVSSPAQRTRSPMNTPFPVRTDGKFTVEEYLAFIESRPEEERWQLIDGIAMMMPPPTVPHQVIAVNLAFELNTHFRQQKRNLLAVQEVGLMVPDVTSFRPEADVAVLETPVDFDVLYADRFYLVAEVLSDSNTDKDIAAKSRRYLQHPQNLYFLLIDQKRVRVEVHARAAGWEPVELKGLDAALVLPEWGLRIPLAALYEGTLLGVTDKA